jgi:predicted TIM-barrel fold metal-dependent hydrolase
LAWLAQVPERPTPLADHHQHLFSAAAVARAPGAGQVDADELVRLLDRAGIRRAAVFSLAYQFASPNRPPVEREYDAVRAENDWTSAQVEKYPDRLRGFCSVNPLADYALDEIARCAKDPRLRIGLKMHFGNSDVDLGNAQHVERLREIFRDANERRMAVIVHLRSTISRKRPYGAASARAFLDRVLPAAPDVPIQIAHLAGAGSYDDPLVDEAIGVFVEAIAKSDARLKRVYFDVSGVAGLGDWKSKADVIAARLRQLGVERILYGSDGAGGRNPTPAEAWVAFTQLPLTAEEIRTIATNLAPYMR